MSKGSISLEVRERAMVAAVRRSAVPIPMDRSMFRLFISLWRAKNGLKRSMVGWVMESCC